MRAVAAAGLATWLTLGITAWVPVAPAVGAEATARGTRWALLIGVDTYEDERLPKLAFCGSDALGLRDALVQYGGFPEDQVIVVHNKAEDDEQRPRYKALKRMLRLVLARPGRNDLLVVAFSGHGIHSLDKKISYLCPTDADLDQPGTTMLSVQELYRMLDEDCKAGQKLVLVDACRNDPEHRAAADGMTKGFSESLRQTPEGVQVLSSCKALEMSREDPKLKHGVFMHYIIEGLQGKADEAGELAQGNQNGQVEVDELFNYASAYTGKYVFKQYHEMQTPELWGVRRGLPIVLSRPSTQAPPLLVAPFDAVTARGQQEAWAKYLRQPPELINSIGMKLKLIPASEFMMGGEESAEAMTTYFKRTYSLDFKAENYKDEYPPHRVRITQPFYLGIYHVTRGQFQHFVNDQGYKTDAEKDGKGGYGTNDEGKWEQKPEYTWRNPGFPQTDEHPVVNVSWNDAVAFCEWLSRKEGKTYRLPTEGQWEYACRAGTMMRYYSGDDSETLAQVGNVADATAKAKFPSWKTIEAKDGYVFTAPVGQFRPNAFGLYDMHGNAWQWCQDWYRGDYYAVSPTDDPKGPDSGSNRVLRGGGWFSIARLCRAAGRIHYEPGHRDDNLGFRVCRVPAE
jgi:formylglycine-generating enzyme required for sulfatase activity